MARSDRHLRRFLNAIDQLVVSASGPRVIARKSSRTQRRSGRAPRHASSAVDDKFGDERTPIDAIEALAA
jgi:hypothetical protein